MGRPYTRGLVVTPGRSRIEGMRLGRDMLDPHPGVDDTHPLARWQDFDRVEVHLHQLRDDLDQRRDPRRASSRAATSPRGLPR